MGERKSFYNLKTHLSDSHETWYIDRCLSDDLLHPLFKSSDLSSYSSFVSGMLQNYCSHVVRFSYSGPLFMTANLP